jgi:hypothetical protein
MGDINSEVCPADEDQIERLACAREEAAHHLGLDSLHAVENRFHNLRDLNQIHQRLFQPAQLAVDFKQ